MAEEGSECSAATSSSTQNWWDLHGNSSLSSWHNTSTSWHHPPNPSPNSSCEDDISMSTSFTNASNQSGLTVDSSRQLVKPASTGKLMGEPAQENHLWSHVLLNAGSNGDLQNSQDIGENFLETLSSKSFTVETYEPACDYLKQMDNSRDFTNSPSFNNFEKQFNGFNGSLIENERLTNLSNLVSNWSIAPPDPEVNRDLNIPTCNISLNASTTQYPIHDLSNIKQNLRTSATNGLATYRNSGLLPCYEHDMNMESQQQEIEVSGGSFQRSPCYTNGISYGVGLNSSVIGGSGKYYYGMTDAPWPNTRNLSDLISFNGSLSKPLMDFHASKPSLRYPNVSDCKKQVPHASSLVQTKRNGRGQGVAVEGKKKRSEDSSGTLLKKPKHESSTVPSLKVQAPKVKISDRITALQQIVSPFGKTDTASVLMEAIGYIKFLQEQVQLLSNPYLKSSPNKDPWGSLEREDKIEVKLDLRSRGLCLVPVSCTPQICRDNAGSDYWTPTYRGCLYR